MISMLTAIRSIQRAKRESDGYRIRKYITLKSMLFIMFANLKLVLRSYTSLYGIFMSASLTLYSYIICVDGASCGISLSGSVWSANDRTEQSRNFISIQAHRHYII